LKNRDLILTIASIAGSGLLWGLSYQSSVFSLVSFAGLLPLFWSINKTNIAGASVIAFSSALLAVFVGVFADLQHMNSGQAILFTVVQTTVLALPWIIYQLIRSRHNQKLGYVAFVSSWLTLEWLSSQFLGIGQSWQLGYSAAVFPLIIQWYCFLGVSAGTLWILSINIHISRIIWPALAHTRRSAIINGSIVLIVPIVASLVWPSGKGSDTISATVVQNKKSAVLMSEGMESLLGKAAKHSGFWYNASNDTLKTAYLINKEGSAELIQGKTVWISGIGGISSQTLMLTDFADIRCGLLNASSFIHAESVRLYSADKCKLLIGFDADRNTDPLKIACRAIENRMNILILTSKGDATLYLNSGSRFDFNGKFSANIADPSFFVLYGDLVGRLSIFVTGWLLLGTLVKPFRKK
jgi:hypothetical protein